MDEPVGSKAVAIGDAAGDSSDFAVVRLCYRGRDHGSALGVAFNDDNDVAQAGYNAVAGEEVSAMYLGVGWIFGDDGTSGTNHACGYVAVVGRIDGAEAVGYDSYGRNVAGEGCAVCGDVYSVCEAAYYYEVGKLLGKVLDDALRNSCSISRGTARADNGYDVGSVKVAVSEPVEQGRGIVASSKASRVVSIGIK